MCVGHAILLAFSPQNFVYLPNIYLWIHFTPRQTHNWQGAFHSNGSQTDFSPIFWLLKPSSAFVQTCHFLFHLAGKNNARYALQHPPKSKTRQKWRRRKKEGSRDLYDRISRLVTQPLLNPAHWGIFYKAQSMPSFVRRLWDTYYYKHHICNVRSTWQKGLLLTPGLDTIKVFI